MPSPDEGERYVRHPEREPDTSGIKDQARTAKEKARSQARSLAEAGREDLATQIGGFGRALRNAGDRLRGEDQERTARYSELIAERAERVAHFLEEHDSDELFGEIENVARRRPLLFLGGCVVAGLALGRFLKASPGGEEETHEPERAEAERPEPFSSEALAEYREPEAMPAGLAGEQAIIGIPEAEPSGGYTATPPRVGPSTAEPAGDEGKEE